MPIEQNHFLAGMNQDSEDRLLQEGEYRYALNVRAGISEGSNFGAITNIKGNTLVTYDLPDGTNQVIGSYEDMLGKRVFYFLYNSLTNHQIIEYNIKSNTTILVLQSPFLNFSRSYPVWHVNLVDTKLLYWTDNYNEPSQLNIERAKKVLGTTGAYPDPFKRQYLDAIKYPSLAAPLAEYSTDTSKKDNNLRGGLFQFKYRYIYIDNNKSAWSPISKVPLPEHAILDGPIPVIAIDKNNQIEIRIVMGEPIIEKIEVAARENRGDSNTQISNLGEFFIIKTFSTESLPPNTSFTFKWGNDEIYLSVDINESDKIFDRVPKKAAAQELADNRLVYANNTVDYDVDGISLKAVQHDSDITPQEEGSSVFNCNVERNVRDGVGSASEPKSWTYYGDMVTIPSNSVIPDGVLTFVVENANPNGGPYTFKIVYSTDMTRLNWDVSDNGIIDHSGSRAFDNGEDPNGVKIPMTPGQVAAAIAFDILALPVYTTLSPPVSLNGGPTIHPTADSFPSGSGEFCCVHPDTINMSGVLPGTGAANCASGTIGLGLSYGDFCLTNNYLKINGLPNNGAYPYGMQNGQWIFPDDRSFMVMRTPGLTHEAFTLADAGLLGPTVSAAGIVASAIYTDNLSGFKRGATHEFGVVYSDKAGRVSPVLNSDDSTVFIPFWTSAVASGVAQMNLEIRTQPPVWAAKYQIVYSRNQTVVRFIQYAPYEWSVIQTAVGKNKLKSKLLNLINDATDDSTLVLSYDYAKGDRMRFISYLDTTTAAGQGLGQGGGGAAGGTNVFFDELLDVEILSFDSGTGEIVVAEPGPPVTTNNGDDLVYDENMLVEIYTPKKTISRKFFFEIGEGLDIGDAGLPTRYHKTHPLPVASYDEDQSLSLNRPVKVRLIRGDVYYKSRYIPNTNDPDGNRQLYAVESYDYADNYISNAIDIGRPHQKDELYQERLLESTVFISEPFIPDTSINGLNSFYGYSYPDTPARAKDYAQHLGSIQKLYTEEKRLIIFQELKVGAALISETIVFSQAGVPTVNKSTEILSDAVYYQGEWGIGNQPGSFAVYGFRKYFTDIRRGSVLRLSQDGITEISEIGMHNYFTDTFKNALSVNDKPMVLGVFDINFDEYIINIKAQKTIEGVWGLPYSQTVVDTHFEGATQTGIQGNADWNARILPSDNTVGGVWDFTAEGVCKVGGLSDGTIITYIEQKPAVTNFVAGNFYKVEIDLSGASQSSYLELSVKAFSGTDTTIGYADQDGKKVLYVTPTDTGNIKILDTAGTFSGCIKSILVNLVSVPQPSISGVFSTSSSPSVPGNTVYPNIVSFPPGTNMTGYDVGDTILMCYDLGTAAFSVPVCVERIIVSVEEVFPPGAVGPGAHSTYAITFDVYVDQALNGIDVTVYDASLISQYIHFNPAILNTGSVYSQLSSITQVEIEFYNQETGQTEIITISVTPTKETSLNGKEGLALQQSVTNLQVLAGQITSSEIFDGDTITILNVLEEDSFNTIAFNETKKRWVSFYSYNPEMIISAESEIVSFKDGKMYLHNNNNTHNNLHGTQYNSEVHVVSNAEPSARKLFLSLIQAASQAWLLKEATNQLGQKTSLIAADFEDIEGDFYAEILKDENTLVANPILEGDDMRSHELTLKLKNSSTNEAKIFSVGVNYINSERTTK